jgi:hypothetical protein
MPVSNLISSSAIVYETIPWYTPVTPSVRLDGLYLHMYHDGILLYPYLLTIHDHLPVPIWCYVTYTVGTASLNNLRKVGAMSYLHYLWSYFVISLKIFVLSRVLLNIALCSEICISADVGLLDCKHPVDLYVDTNVSEEHTATIFSVEVCSSEPLASTYLSTRCYNPEEQHRHLRRENVNSKIHKL